MHGGTMRFRQSLTIPAGTAEDNPAAATMKLSAGIITEVEVQFPAGQSGLVHLAIDRYETQLYPLTPGESFIGDDQLITIEDAYALLVEPYSVRLRGWAPDAELEHTVYVDMTVMPREPERSSGIAYVTLPGE